jgi:hypothetical protein
MTRVRHCLPIITAACLTSIGPVQADDSAGVLREVRGTVLVNQGTNYVVGYSGMELKPGARVLTPDGATAVVKQTDGCLTPIEPNLRFILRESSICQTGVATMETIDPSDTGAIGGGTTKDAPAVASGATNDKGPSIEKGSSIMETIEITAQQRGRQGVDETPPSISRFR